MRKPLERYLVKPKNSFSGSISPFNDARYVVFGFPYDGTSTYRLGSRRGPLAIREASLNIETYSFRSGVYLEDTAICDLGDVRVKPALETSLNVVHKVAGNILKFNKTPIVLGGEHTLTLSLIRSIPKNTAIVSFDAHFDLRDEYEGKRLSHATFMRRFAEQGESERLYFVGTRAVSKDEMAYVSANKIKYMPASKLRRQVPDRAAKALRDHLSSFDGVYITIDMDVLDPSQAPDVGNPEAEGLSFVEMLDLIYGFCDGRLVGFDVVEVAPAGSRSVASIYAAKAIFELICLIERG